MPLHDHPNMSVFFRLVMGNLHYHAYDKVDKKFQYNEFACQEYDELIEDKKTIVAKKSKPMNIKAGDMLFVRPSTNNMHQFVAKENSCFFDIMLPNYSPEYILRKMTYFEEVGKTRDNCTRGGLTRIQYNTTPELGLPQGFEIN